MLIKSAYALYNDFLFPLIYTKAKTNKIEGASVKVCRTRYSNALCV